MEVSIAFQDQNCFTPPEFQLYHRQNLQINPDVIITAEDFRSAEENVSTVATRSINPQGILAAVSRGAVKGDRAALVAVGRVYGPCSLIPSVFKVLGDLCKGKGEESKGEKSGLAEHCCGWNAVGSTEIGKDMTVKKGNFRKRARPSYLCAQINIY